VRKGKKLQKSCKGFKERMNEKFEWEEKTYYPARLCATSTGLSRYRLFLDP